VTDDFSQLAPQSCRCPFSDAKTASRKSNHRKETVMKATQAAQTTQQITLSHAALIETPYHAYQFLKGAANGEVNKQLATVGYDRAAHLEGWSLFYQVSNAGPSHSVESPENISSKAIADIKAWIVQGFRRVRATLDRKWPDVSKFVFADIDGTNNGPVFEMATFLDRIDDLEKSPERKATRKQDHAALEALSSRGLNDVVFKQLRTLLNEVQVVQAAPVTGSVDAGTDAVTELYLWLRDWREQARAVVKNKSQLRMLGIGGKRAKKSATTTAPTTPALPAAPITITPVAPQAPTTPIAQLTQGSASPDATK
jgi:hypothetical protein